MIGSIIFLLILALIYICAAYILYKKYKTKKWIKYIPAIISLIFAMVNYSMINSTMGILKSARIGMVVMCGTGFLAGFITAVFLDTLYNRIVKSKADK